jgi:cobalt-zinc-cadmium resistance protein CzcA
LIGSGLDIGKTELYYNEDAANIARNDLPLNTWGIGQTIKCPTVYGAQRRVLKGQSKLAGDQFEMDKYTVTKAVLQTYNEIVYWQEMLENYSYLDSLYTVFEYAADRKFKQGESNYLEKLTAETKSKEISVLLQQIEESKQNGYIRLRFWLQSDSNYTVSARTLTRMDLMALDTNMHPVIQYYADMVALADEKIVLEKQQLLPDLNAAVYQGRNDGPGVQHYSGFTVGVGIPLWMGTQKSRIAAAKTGAMVSNAEAENYRMQLIAGHQGFQSDLKKYEEGLVYYEESGKNLSKQTVYHAVSAFQNGEIDFLQYIKLLENAIDIEINYITTLLHYNTAVIEANYILN